VHASIAVSTSLARLCARTPLGLVVWWSLPFATPSLLLQVDGANDHLHNLNRKMKNALKEVRSADRFILDFILIVIVLGIATYIYNMFNGNA